MNPTILGVIGPGFLNQVPTLGFNSSGLFHFRGFRCFGFGLQGFTDLGFEVFGMARDQLSLGILDLLSTLKPEP